MKAAWYRLLIIWTAIWCMLMKHKPHCTRTHILSICIYVPGFGGRPHMDKSKIERCWVKNWGWFFVGEKRKMLGIWITHISYTFLSLNARNVIHYNELCSIRTSYTSFNTVCDDGDGVIWHACIAIHQHIQSKKTKNTRLEPPSFWIANSNNDTRLECLYVCNCFLVQLTKWFHFAYRTS